MQLIVDRFEGKFAVCEKPDRTMVNIPFAKLPPDVAEGDVLSVQGDNIIIDIEATKERKQKIRKLMENLWN